MRGSTSTIQAAAVHWKHKLAKIPEPLETSGPSIKFIHYSGEWHYVICTHRASIPLQYSSLDLEDLELEFG
jgi:hypothetical protein